LKRTHQVIEKREMVASLVLECSKEIQLLAIKFAEI